MAGSARGGQAAWAGRWRAWRRGRLRAPGLGEARRGADAWPDRRPRGLALRAFYPGVGIAWVIHFPPCATEGESPLLELLDRASVLDAARDERIRLILAGHIHTPALVEDGDILISCAGTAAAYLCKQGYWIYKLEIEVTDSIASLTDRTNFAWNGSDFAVRQI